jgi:hypothetical protein
MLDVRHCELNPWWAAFNYRADTSAMTFPETGKSKDFA